MKTSPVTRPAPQGPNVLRSILALRDAGVLTPEQAIDKAADADEGFAFLVGRTERTAS